MAVQRYRGGESAKSICVSLSRTKPWLYKWVKRYDSDDPEWYCERSRAPRTCPKRISPEIEEIVRQTRQALEKDGLFSGAQSILWELEEADITPLPSLRSVNRILSRNGLIHRREGPYEPKGTPYPALATEVPNRRHQADFVGPRYLRGRTKSLRFYSLNIVDLATGRCACEPLLERGQNAVCKAFWLTWGRIGMPRQIQVDNEMVFYGSPTYPRGMGPLIRLCLHFDIEPWFIPQAEPWRNGVVEQFNRHYQQKFLGRFQMETVHDLRTGSLAFEQKHNSRYRYSKLNGRTPLKALNELNKKPLRFPPDQMVPKAPMEKPQSGRYHLIRLIRSDCTLDIFGERFHVPSNLQYEYVVATIDVKEQKLKLIHEEIQVDEFDYKLR